MTFLKSQAESLNKLKFKMIDYQKQIDLNNIIWVYIRPPFLKLILKVLQRHLNY